MKQLLSFLTALIVIVSSCSKAGNNDTINNKAGNNSTTSQAPASKGGSGSGGGNTTTGLIQSFLSGTASRLVSNTTDSILVSFSQPAPAGGWTLSLTSSNPSAASVPATYFVPAGATVVYPRVTGGNVVNTASVTITVRLNAETKTTTIKVFPLTATFPAPSLQSPGNGASFKPREIITFRSNTNDNAFYYELQIDNNANFTNAGTNLLLNDPVWVQSAFSGFTNYWRMRFVAAGGTAGPWSQVRTFSIRQ